MVLLHITYMRAMYILVVILDLLHNIAKQVLMVLQQLGNAPRVLHHSASLYIAIRSTPVITGAAIKTIHVLQLKISVSKKHQNKCWSKSSMI